MTALRTFCFLTAMLALAACQGEPAPEPIGTEPVAPPDQIDNGLRTEPDTTGSEDDGRAAALTFPHGPYLYTCAEGRAFKAVFPTRDSVRVTLDRGEALTLANVTSGSGARYSDGTTEAWFRGMDEGFLQENGATTYADCRRTE